MGTLRLHCVSVCKAEGSARVRTWLDTGGAKLYEEPRRGSPNRHAERVVSLLTVTLSSPVYLPLIADEFESGPDIRGKRRAVVEHNTCTTRESGYRSVPYHPAGLKMPPSALYILSAGVETNSSVLIETLIR